MTPPTLFASAEGERWADISPCGKYRYTLGRRWDPSLPMVLWVMLNPSTADAAKDDPTIRKCIGFAKRWGMGGLLVWNLYAYRATDPRELDEVDDPIGGRENENALWRILWADTPPALIIAAWGAKPNRGRYGSREYMVRVGPLYERSVAALGLTKDDHPRHPVRLAYATALVPFNLASEDR